MKRFIILSLIIISNIIIAQSKELNRKVTPFVSVGCGTASMSSIAYLPTRSICYDLMQYNPKLSTLAGIKFGPVFNIYGLNADLSLQAGYFSAASDTYQAYDGNSMSEEHTTSVSISMIFEPDTRLRPFIKIGTGMARKEYIEKNYDHTELSAEGAKWFLAVNAAAGLTFNVTTSIELSVFLESVCIDGELAAKNSYNEYITFSGIQATYFAGLQIGCSL